MDLKEEKIYIRGFGLNYLKTGSGEHPVLLLPGVLGSIWTNFKPLIENLDRERFTIIAWDPPGYGKSIPPTRKFSADILQQDATCANDLMKALGYETFSMIGWCSGGSTACILAAMYPESVRKTILIATKANLLPEQMTVYNLSRDFTYWPPKSWTSMIDLYGEDYVRRVWPTWVDELTDIYENRKGNICMDFLDRIQCPTLIVHGEGDRIVDLSQAMLLKEKIRHSSVHVFEDGNHHLHLKFPKEFNELAEDFLTNSSNDES